MWRKEGIICIHSGTFSFFKSGHARITLRVKKVISMKIGFVGQGFVGKNIANDFEARGYEVIRYALESEYLANKDLIKLCDVVFVAVPTPTTPQGFDFSAVEDSLSLVGEKKVVVVKSTLIPGTTRKLQKNHPDLVVLFSPEFLCEATAAQDASHPIFNIIGTADDSVEHRVAAQTVMSILPQSKYSFMISSNAAELFKYTHNIHGYMRVVLSNLLYDMAETINVDWESIEHIMNVDPMMSPYYNSPVHKNGRGAGGNCFIKDMAAFSKLYAELLPHDAIGSKLFKTFEQKNLELLASTGKNKDIVEGVYGYEEILK